jgi:hypothetical protein
MDNNFKKIVYSSLDTNFFLEKFPELREEILDESELSEGLPHCLFADVLNPKVINLIEQDDYKNNNLLLKIFLFYEELAVYGDEKSQNLLQVSLLERLWDRKITFDRAIELMGSYTENIFQEIGEYLDKPYY